MDVNILKTVGQIAGIAGIAVGVLLIIFRAPIHQLIRKNIAPKLTKQQSYNLLRNIIFFTWSIAVIGILAWAFSGKFSVLPAVETPANDKPTNITNATIIQDSSCKAPSINPI